MWGKIPAEIPGVFAKHGVLPLTVAVNSPRLARVLEPVAGPLQLTVETDAPLRALRAARRALERQFRR